MTGLFFFPIPTLFTNTKEPKMARGRPRKNPLAAEERIPRVRLYDHRIVIHLDSHDDIEFNIENEKEAITLEEVLPRFHTWLMNKEDISSEFFEVRIPNNDCYYIKRCNVQGISIAKE
jgi:hypothetical protein